MIKLKFESSQNKIYHSWEWIIEEARGFSFSSGSYFIILYDKNMHKILALTTDLLVCVENTEG